MYGKYTFVTLRAHKIVADVGKDLIPQMAELDIAAQPNGIDITAPLLTNTNNINNNINNNNNNNNNTHDLPIVPHTARIQLLAILEDTIAGVVEIGDMHLRLEDGVILNIDERPVNIGIGANHNDFGGGGS
eukprot:TRINITY_DN10564_c0_g2_i1.p1 TRINITY_DN10564_c0_g2~~TRINITY_DN10564_c0_g2_i1.p1  ORF type:complete len:151 (+),score=34.83 TRINITY_DN10564_c0_g2_i1:62-454(+)